MEKYKIGEVSKIKNIDKQTLRYYDKLGLLNPQMIDNENGYRYYTMDQFIEVDSIKFCKLMGMTLEEIVNFNNIKTADEAIDFLIEKQQLFEKELIKKQVILKHMKERMVEIQEKRKQYDQVGDMIRIEYFEDVYGVTGECKNTNDWFSFEEKLLEITKKYPQYYDIGDNSELYFIYRSDFLTANTRIDEDVEYMKKMILPISKDYKNEENVEQIKLGKCLVMFIGENREDFIKCMSKMNDHIEQNGLKIRGDIIISPIVNYFIVRNNDEALHEMKIPLL